MDAAQFKEFLAVFQQQQQEQFQQLLTKFSKEGNSEDSVSRPRPITNIAPFENFEPKQEKFCNYLERFENYYTMKGLTLKEDIAQLLCVSIGSVHYNALSAFLGPEKPIKNLTYDELIKVLTQMLVPKKNVVVSQHYFLNIYQKNEQSISDFVASLQRDLADCELTVKCGCEKVISISDVFLRAQFIRGLRDDWLKEQILQSNLSSFDEILSKAIALEASKIDSKELSKPNQTSSSNFTYNETNAISSTFRHSRNRSRDPGSRRSNSTNNKSTDNRRPRSSSRKRHIDFKALGIENLCLRCGKSNHKASNCTIGLKKLSCNLCKRKGHVSKVCIQSLLKNSKVDSVETCINNDCQTYNQNTFDPNYGIHNINCDIVDLFEMKPDLDKYLIDVKLNGKHQRFEVDSGAKFSLLSESDYNKLNLGLPLETSNVCFRSYTGNIIKPVGKVSVTVTYNGKQLDSELHIVPAGYDALLGRQWIRGLGIELQQVYSEMFQQPSNHHNSVHNVHSINDILNKFSPIFEQKVGCVPHFKVSLQLRNGAKPIYTREREVPYALRELVEKELYTLEAEGIISKVTTSDWGSPLVVILKPNGGVRLCVDYKCGVNDRLVQANHPIRRIDDVLNSLRNSKYFCKLDLFKAYLHLQVDEESSKIQTISTHRGTYRIHRLSFGIKTAPAEFNRILSQIIMGLQKTESYFDDIIVHGSTYDECMQNLQACLQRLSDYNLHVNRNKCIFMTETVEYLGHVVQYNKISKSPAKVQAVQGMPRPHNVEELKRFLGLVTYYSRFIPNFSTITFPLRCLLKKSEHWIWTAACESAFLKLKEELCSDRVIVPFDPDLPLIMTTDASPTGVAAVLSHEIKGVERPIAYASRSLNPSEMNYSQLDREALGIIFGVNHFYNYLIGKKFILVTDNQPLTRIFHQNKTLPQMTSARLLRYASFLSGFDYTVRFKKGSDNQNVDCFSRAPVKICSNSVDQLVGEEVNQIYSQSIFQISSFDITSKTIKEETAKDKTLNEIIENLKKQSVDSEYTLLDGILFRKDRILIPPTLRPKILNELHENHLGITKMKQLARRYVYWPGLDREIERLVKECKSCALVKSSPPKVLVHPWTLPENNWDRIHIDYAGPFENHYFLVCIDAKSKWIEIEVLKEPPTSSNTINLLEKIFFTHGYPKECVSDNATIFTSEEFKMYTKNHGIFQKFIAPGHPATNGLAERNVQTLKNKLKSASEEQGTLTDKVRRILFRYRATPLANNKTPAELYLNRKIRIRLDAIFPYQHTKSSNLPVSKPVRSIQEGERVQVQMYSNNKQIWQFGVIRKKLGKQHYYITLDNGRDIKRHINQLRPSLVSKEKKVTFGPKQSFDVPRIPNRLPDHLNQRPDQIEPDQLVEANVSCRSPKPVRERRQPHWFKDFIVNY